MTFTVKDGGTWQIRRERWITALNGPQSTTLCHIGVKAERPKLGAIQSINSEEEREPVCARDQPVPAVLFTTLRLYILKSCGGMLANGLRGKDSTISCG